jgi:hypothetical protein
MIDLPRDGWDSETPDSLPSLQRFQVYRVSHPPLEHGEAIRVIQPCVIVNAIDQLEAIERVSGFGCWTIGYGHEKMRGAFLIAAPAWESQRAVRARFGDGIPVSILS